MADGNLDVSAEFAQNSVKINEGERLRFARHLLLGMAVIIVAVFVAYAAMPGNTALAAIFELIKIGALPLITLIVSFYFPNSGK